ncbi:unnamed protein product [Cuscuta epithymum]|uniref:Uncharacterized protein n=1 Tax=Cuscuta epithymum TaxID=186058 RepID=A0AAV0CAH7_9ASTE|nr:unnamed protein product [Cuscuta epithymum]
MYCPLPSLICQLRQKVNIPPSPHHCIRPAPRREGKRSSESSSSIANSSPSSNKEKGKSLGEKKGEKGVEIKFQEELEVATLPVVREDPRRENVVRVFLRFLILKQY